MKRETGNVYDAQWIYLVFISLTEEFDYVNHWWKKEEEEVKTIYIDETCQTTQEDEDKYPFLLSWINCIEQ
jgi:hypothetical protein